jgi:hypothetical protein
MAHRQSLVAGAFDERSSRSSTMSRLVFDGTSHTLTLFDSHNQQVGQWPANNLVDHRCTLKFLPNRTYVMKDNAHPHRHKGDADTLNGKFGRFGILRLEDFNGPDGKVHQGVGVHAGRANKGAQNHATEGCVRTTDAAMEAIVKFIQKDPLTTITVQHNHDQHNPHPSQHGDGHHQTQPSHSSASSGAILV